MAIHDATAKVGKCQSQRVRATTGQAWGCPRTRCIPVRSPSSPSKVFNAAGELLLLRRANTGFMDGRYGLPGGHRQAGEGVTAAYHVVALAGFADALPDQRLASKMKSTPPS